MPHPDVNSDNQTPRSMLSPRLLGFAAAAVLVPFGLGSLWRAARFRDLALDLDPFEIDLQLRDRNDVG